MKSFLTLILYLMLVTFVFARHVQHPGAMPAGQGSYGNVPAYDPIGVILLLTGVLLGISIALSVARKPAR